MSNSIGTGFKRNFPAPLDDDLVAADLSDVEAGIRYLGMIVTQTGTGTVVPGAGVYYLKTGLTDSDWEAIGGGGGAGDLVLGTDNESPDRTSVTFYSGGAVAPTDGVWRMRSSRGVALAPTAIQNTDEYGTFSMGGFGAGGFNEDLVSISARAMEAFDGTHGGSQLLERSTPSASITSVIRRILDADGTTYWGSTTAGALASLDQNGVFLSRRVIPSLGIYNASQPPMLPMSRSQRSWNAAIARRGTTQVMGILIADSLEATDPSDSTVTGYPAIMERFAAHHYCDAQRTSGFVNVNQKKVDGTTNTGAKFATLSGTVTGSHGLSFRNAELSTGDYVEDTRAGTGVTIYYTAVRTGGAVLTVSLDDGSGAVDQATTINTTDATIPATPGYDCGRFVYYPFAKGFGSVTVKVRYTSGTTGQIDGGYWHNLNSPADSNPGFAYLRAGLPGSGMTRHLLRASAGGDYLYPDTMHYIKNLRPQLVDIVEGANDCWASPNRGCNVAAPNNIGSAGNYVGTQPWVAAAATATQFGILITDLLALIRSFYGSVAFTGTITGTTTCTMTAGRLSPTDTGRIVTGSGIPANTTITYVSPTVGTLSNASTNAAGVSITLAAELPAIRFVFEHFNGVSPATWLTDYKAAAREACRVDNDVMFLDLAEAVGATDPTDPMQLTVDGTHFGDAGNYVLGNLLASSMIPTTPLVGTRLRLDGTLANSQRSTAYLGDIGIIGDNYAPRFRLKIDGKGFPANGDTLAAYTAEGRYAANTFAPAAWWRGRADGTWSATNTPGRFEILTIEDGDATLTSKVALIVDQARTTYFGQNLSALAKITALGAATFASASIKAAGPPDFATTNDAGAAVSSGGYLGRWIGYGARDASGNLYSGAEISMIADEDFATAGTHSGTRISFATSAIGSGGTRTVRGGIDNAGIWFGGPSAARKWTISAISGDAHFDGALDVDGATTLDGTANVAGNFSVATNKFQANATTGNGVFAGTLDVGNTLDITQPTLGTRVLGLFTTATNDDPSCVFLQGRVTTTTNAATTIITYSPATSKVIYIWADIIGRRTGGTQVAGAVGDGLGGRVEGLFRNVGGTITQIGSQVNSKNADTNLNGSYAFVISGSDILLQVTGITNCNIVWHATAHHESVGT